MKLLVILSILFSCNFSWGLSKADKKLLTCSKYGYLHCVKVALQQETNVMAKEESWEEYIPLHLAALGGHLEIVQLLIEKNSNIEHIMATTSQGDTPLHLAAEEGHLKIVKFLIEKHPSPEHNIMARNKVGGFTPVHTATMFGRFEIVQFLISKHPVPEHIMIKNFYQDTPLHLAAKARSAHTLRTLIDALPTKEHILAKNGAEHTPFDLSLRITHRTGVRILFGHSPRELKPQLVKTCKENKFVDQQLCEQLSFSLNSQTSSTTGDYQ